MEYDDSVTGLAVGGSWITERIDEFSDLDLIVVTKEKVGGNKTAMLSYAQRFGCLLTAFTGEHVGEPRLLICLYDKPLLHVDLKFVTLDEFQTRVEEPHILLDKNGQLEDVLKTTKASYPMPDYQWLEDRFWIWMHYALLKIGRGEYLESLDFFAFVRAVVLGPLLHIKNGRLPRGVRKVETDLPFEDLQALHRTLPRADRDSQLRALDDAVSLYRLLRDRLFKNVQLQTRTEERVMEYLHEIKERN